ncbi:MAG: imidazole glycerol phosphate synthase subunit HisH [Proteobacteria bacterium]|nr:imidazole glycerol phosphate synthase subunit HisH [Pseudomonadota bacterium]
MPPKASPRIALVDTGAGNLRSVAKALERSLLRVDVTGDAGAIADADGLVLPGVGAFASAAQALAAKGLDDAVKRALERGRPYLGLCLGLQLLFDESDEHGPTPGFGVLRGRVERFAAAGPDGRKRRVPHIGWNTVRFRGRHPMLAHLPESDVFYFVHAYHAVPANADDVAGVVDYEGDFVAAVAGPTLFAVQFHPEKSQQSGKRLLDAYAAWVREA